jgi:uncharacterized protein (TIGR03086 family)
METTRDSAGAEQLGQALASTRAILARVQRDQLNLATPCASWDVRSLINHFVGTARWAAAAVGGAEEETGLDYAAADYLASYDEHIKIALAAFEADGVLDRPVQLAFGEFPGAYVLGIATTDQFVHGWDLARAIGDDTGLDPELASELLLRAGREVTDGLRGPDGTAPFGAVTKAPAGAQPADQLAAFLGRRV